MVRLRRAAMRALRPFVILGGWLAAPFAAAYRRVEFADLIGLVGISALGAGVEEVYGRGWMLITLGGLTLFLYLVREVRAAMAAARAPRSSSGGR